MDCIERAIEFSHRDDPSRLATLVGQATEPPAVVVEHTDASGKRRRKTFKNASAGRAHDAALRFLLNREGYLIRAPQSGPVLWMARLVLDGYRGEIGHAVDLITGQVWVADAEDKVHRIEPGTCETTTVSLRSGHESPCAHVAAGIDGSAWVLAPTWVRRGGELVRQLRMVRVRPDGDSLTVDEIVRATGASVSASLSSDRTGCAVGPCEGGTALYAPDATVIRRWSLPTPEKGSPVSALSGNGEWVAMSAAQGVLRVHLPTGRETTLGADFETVNGLQICDDGSVYLSGFRYPSHGLWQLGAGEPVRVSTDTRATVSADGELLVEAAHNRLTLRDPSLESDDDSPMELRHVVARATLPVLGMAKYGCARFGVDGQLVVLTDAYTVAAVARDRLT